MTNRVSVGTLRNSQLSVIYARGAPPPRGFHCSDVFYRLLSFLEIHAFSLHSEATKDKRGNRFFPIKNDEAFKSRAINSFIPFISANLEFIDFFAEFMISLRAQCEIAQFSFLFVALKMNPLDIPIQATLGSGTAKILLLQLYFRSWTLTLSNRGLQPCRARSTIGRRMSTSDARRLQPCSIGV